MKPYERRRLGAYPYYRLAKWDDRSMCFKDGKRTQPTEQSARQGAYVPGKYRISRITADGRVDLPEFTVAQPL